MTFEARLVNVTDTVQVICDRGNPLSIPPGAATRWYPITNGAYWLLLARLGSRPAGAAWRVELRCRSEAGVA